MLAFILHVHNVLALELIMLSIYHLSPISSSQDQYPQVMTVVPHHYPMSSNVSRHRPKLGSNLVGHLLVTLVDLDLQALHLHRKVERMTNIAAV